MDTSGLSLEQAPPLRIPAIFFVTAPVAILIVGVALVVLGADALSPAGPAGRGAWPHDLRLTIALTHVLTLGLLASVMFGALYQMTPVVAGEPVPFVRTAYGVAPLLWIGVAGLAVGIGRHVPLAAAFGMVGAAGAAALFVAPVWTALVRAPVRDTTVAGMRLAVACFAGVVVTGSWMARGYSSMHFVEQRVPWIELHALLALAGWVGALIIAVSWQVIPMFYLARPQLPSMIKWGVQILAVLGAVGPILLLAFASLWEGLFAADALSRYAAWALSPAILSIWCIHPVASFWSLQGRRSRRSDGSLLFWKTGLLLAPLTAFGALAAFMAASPNWDLAFGWLAIWGWAGMIMHGMLTRIAPFLVWLHRFAPLVGHIPVPSVRKILPNPWIRIGYSLHLGSLIAGLLALATGWQPLTRLTGLGLMATAAWMGVMFIRVLSQKAAEASEAG